MVVTEFAPLAVLPLPFHAPSADTVQRNVWGAAFVASCDPCQNVKVSITVSPVALLTLTDADVPEVPELDAKVPSGVV